MHIFDEHILLSHVKTIHEPLPPHKHHPLTIVLAISETPEVLVADEFHRGMQTNIPEPESVVLA